MTLKTEYLSQELHDYIVSRSTPVDPVLRELAEETAARYPDDIGLQIGPEQGIFMTLLTQVAGARRAVEVGTFTGYSSICVARGLAPGGTMLCCDVSEEWTSLARQYWQRAGLADRIELRLGPAVATLESLPEEPSFDLAFVDADKPSYPRYWELLVPRLVPGGLLLADNTLSHGRVVNQAEQGKEVRGIRAFNDLARSDPRVELVLLPIGDGLTLARKL